MWQKVDSQWAGVKHAGEELRLPEQVAMLARAGKQQGHSMESIPERQICSLLGHYWAP